VKRTPLKRKPWRKALGTASQRLSFKREVLATDGECVMTTQLGRDWVRVKSKVPCDGPLQAAHVIRKQTLRERGLGAEWVYSVDAAFTACQRHHERHDRGIERVPWDLLPARCQRFVQSLGLMHILQKQGVVA
jgi:hypothetical protein